MISLQLNDAGRSRAVSLDSFPFVIGRAPGCQLALANASVSRAHAVILSQGNELVLEDTQSRHGTFVNGQRIERHRLQPGDRMQFGSLDGPQLIFARDAAVAMPPQHIAHQTIAQQTIAQQTIVEQIHAIGEQRSDLERLRWFLHAAQQLNAAGTVNGVLASLLEATLALARVERGYVFLAREDGRLELALGMDSSGNRLDRAASVSNTVLRQASEGGDQFLITDSLAALGTVPQSIVASAVRSIICIPLRRSRGAETQEDAVQQQVFGALYLDSRLDAQQRSQMDHDLLRTIAREASALIENAELAVKADEARQQEKELQIAASIQQGLMRVQIPAFDFAQVSGHNAACSAVGGDFYDVVAGATTLNVALVDVSGKGIAAAMLASTLQGMLFTQLEAEQPLDAIAAAANKYLCHKNLGKYATMVLLRFHPDGALDYINCGHIQPRLCTGGKVSRLEAGNLPVGLIRAATYAVTSIQLPPDASIVLVSDGFTEAEDAAGNCCGEEGLDQASLLPTLQQITRHLTDFCKGHPANDDCTVVQIVLTPQKTPVAI